jgi:hypothetical protein
VKFFKTSLRRIQGSGKTWTLRAAVDRLKQAPIAPTSISAEQFSENFSPKNFGTHFRPQILDKSLDKFSSSKLSTNVRPKNNRCKINLSIMDNDIEF